MNDPSLMDFSYMTNDIPFSTVMIGSFEVAFVAVLETLISARIADGLTGTRFNQPKEVFAMSLGNMLSGLMGGSPCTGVLVRTAVNVKSGATNKMSQFINAMCVMCVVFIFMPAFVYTPLPCIAAILITSACRLFPMAQIKELWEVDRAELVNLFIVAGICVFVDGAMGLGVGAVISVLRTAVKS